MNWKYVVFEPPGDLPPFGIAFPSTLLHKQVAAAFASMARPVSAGFIGATVIAGQARPRCYGESDSLKLSARVEDEAFFAHLFQ